jgi:hypothetical protein
MATSPKETAREIFRPEGQRNPLLVFSELVFVFILCVASGLAPLLGLVAMIAYSTFAWSNFLTAIWLLRRDSCRRRGRVCFLFCMSRAVLKVVLATLGLAMAFSNPFPSIGWGHPVDSNVQVTLIAGIAIYLALAVFGCALARNYGVRVWIDSGLNWSRRRRLWPPRCRGSSNEAVDVWHLLVACLLVLLTGSGELLWGNRSLVVGCILGAGLFEFLLLSRKISATTPEECWHSRNSALDSASDSSIFGGTN